MIESIENIKLIYSKTAHRTQKKLIKPRKYHLFGIGVSGERTVDFDGKCLKSPKGTLIFIPKGLSYEYTPIGEICTSTTICFDADIKNPTPKVYDISDYSNYEKLIKSFPELCSMKTSSSEHKCLSMFHSLISYLIDIETIGYAHKRKYKLIEPALRYIDNNFTNDNIKPGNLHLLCNISPAYFRRLFMANIGMSPLKYIEEKRLDYSINILNANQGISIGELAALSGYNDPLYFGKVFKKKYGISPSYFKNE